MPNSGDIFRDSIIYLIKSWGIKGLEIYKEPYVAERFVGNKRKLDVVLRHGDKSLGIEAKYQDSSGTAYQKLVYALEDCKVSPIKCIIVFSGKEIKPDTKAMLISSGLALEVAFDKKTKKIKSGIDILKQRILIELGLNWLEDQRNKLQ